MYNFWEKFPKGLTVGKEVNRRPFLLLRPVFAILLYVLNILKFPYLSHLFGTISTTIGLLSIVELLFNKVEFNNKSCFLGEAVSISEEISSKLQGFLLKGFGGGVGTKSSSTSLSSSSLAAIIIN